MLLEEIKNIKSAKKDLKMFGLTVGGVLFALGGVLWYFEKANFLFFLIIGAGLAATGLIFPRILFPLQKAWMTFGVIMGWLMTRVVLSLLFFLVMTPLSLALRATGKKFLDIGIDAKSKSYWSRRQVRSADTETYKKQF